MKITKLETFHVKPRWLFLKIHTDIDGLFGWGEPVLEGRALTVETAVHEAARVLVGQDPRRIEHLWQLLYRGAFYRGSGVLTSALSGIEQALWDILGKHFNTPVYQLLGGRVRDKVRLYTWAGPEPADLPRVKQLAQQQGFTAFKMGPTYGMRHLESPANIDKAVARLASLREALGPDVDIALDLHGRCSPALSRQLIERFAPYRPMFIEEPVLPGDTLALKDISRSATTPIATEERLFTRWQFQDLIEQEAVAVVQPDLSHCGGIFEARKIAAMAESRNIAIAPHCPLGPITLAASLQLDACTPNFLIQEHVTLGDDYLKHPFNLEQGGYVKVPEAPGLGIDVDEEKVKAGQFDGTWDPPTWFAEDGSFTEW